MSDTALPEVIGSRLRAVRTSANRSLSSVAREVGISASALSQIESGAMRPSVKRLVEILSALGAPVSAVFTDAGLFRRADAEGGVEVSEPLDGVHLALPARAASARLGEGVTYRRLAPVVIPGLDLFESVYPPGTSSSPDGGMLVHTGYDCGSIVRGELTFEFTEGTVRVPAGGSLSFSATRPHRVVNETADVAVAVWATVSVAGNPDTRRERSRITVTRTKPRNDR
ncbi:XRE family transcriptional regulator [Pseudonocardia nematodicida]|uniref:XRE family transcriptional regulator n=1 Tax=Pseudonocardia nematodicida TaxID=1206997 RepID=A0ABV1KIG7_9PSEU